MRFPHRSPIAITVLALVWFGVLASAQLVAAVEPGTAGTDANAVVLPNPLPASDIPTILGGVLRAAFGILGSIALLMFIYGGFLWLTSGGEAEKIEKGKQTMVWAILGIAVIFASYAIVGFLITALTKTG